MAHFWSTQPLSTENKLNGTIARDCIVLGKLNGNIKAAKLFPRLFHFQICEKMTENLQLFCTNTLKRISTQAPAPAYKRTWLRK